MSNQNQFNRRDFLKLTGLGIATSALYGCGVFSGRENSYTIYDFAGQHWQPYQDSIVIDGLAGAIDVKKAKLSVDTLALYTHSGITAINDTIAYPGDNFIQANEKVDKALAQIDAHSEHLKLIKTSEDLLEAKKHGQLGIIMGFQSTEMFGNDVSNIEHFANRGVRYMQMSYNGPSQFGSGGLVQGDTGLTNLGKEALAVMEQNRVLVDLSHSGKQTVASAIAVSKRPLTISHTGCNTIYRHPRNNDDVELKAVADKGGVVGIYLMPFLEGGTHEITASGVIAHIKHAVNTCGIDHVSIGSDQGVKPVNDGPEYREAVRKDVEARIAAGISAPGETPNRPPFIAELNSERRMELIAWHLVKAGFNDVEIQKLLGNNLMRLYNDVW
jgi:membrane dipeptidase